MHVHIGSYQDGVKVLPRLVGYGITGVRDMASPVDDILRLRRDADNSTIFGPQIIAAGPILQGPLPFTLPPMVRTITDRSLRQGSHRQPRLPVRPCAAESVRQIVR